MSQTVLVVAAHPDDEILGGGGTFVKRLRQGDEVHAVVVCEGESVRYEGMEVNQQAHARAAAEVMGFTSFRCLGLPEQRLDTISQIDLNQRFEAIIDELRPSVIYTHFERDANRDHQLISASVLVAARPGREFVREIYAFETASSTGLYPPNWFDPDTFVDVEETLETKLEAMACYLTEAPPYPHPRSIESLRHRAAYWGSIVHRAAVEPFKTLRRIE